MSLVALVSSSRYYLDSKYNRDRPHCHCRSTVLSLVSHLTLADTEDSLVYLGLSCCKNRRSALLLLFFFSFSALTPQINRAKMIRTFSRIMSASAVMQCREGRGTREYITGIFARRCVFIAQRVLVWTGLMYLDINTIKLAFHFIYLSMSIICEFLHCLLRKLHESDVGIVL